MIGQLGSLAPALVGLLQQRAHETAFQNWYSQLAAKTGLSPNPDDPSHGYDYRAAFAAGANPAFVQDTDIPGWYWPSQFKTQSNPRRLLSKNKNGASVWSGSGPAFDTILGKMLSEKEAKDSE